MSATYILLGIVLACSGVFLARKQKERDRAREKLAYEEVCMAFPAWSEQVQRVFGSQVAVQAKREHCIPSKALARILHGSKIPPKMHGILLTHLHKLGFAGAGDAKLTMALCEELYARAPKKDRWSVDARRLVPVPQMTPVIQTLGETAEHLKYEPLVRDGHILLEALRASSKGSFTSRAFVRVWRAYLARHTAHRQTPWQMLPRRTP